jgi:hypothetical protein
MVSTKWEVRLTYRDGSKRTTWVMADDAEDAEFLAMRHEPEGTVPMAYEPYGDDSAQTDVALARDSERASRNDEPVEPYVGQHRLVSVLGSDSDVSDHAGPVTLTEDEAFVVALALSDWLQQNEPGDDPDSQARHAHTERVMERFI